MQLITEILVGKYCVLLLKFTNKLTLTNHKICQKTHFENLEYAARIFLKYTLKYVVKI